MNQYSILLITLDSCRYDSFVAASVPNMKKLGQVYLALSNSTFTYGAHQCIFMGFLPSCQAEVKYFNSKYGKLFKIGSSEFVKEEPLFRLQGRNIINGLNNKGYTTIGTGAVRWFDTSSETGRILPQEFDEFYYSGNTYSLNKQLTFLEQSLVRYSDKKLFMFLNVGETHVPYYFDGAEWERSYNPCLPFNINKTNDAGECKRRQIACLEYIDRQIEPLLHKFANIIITSDHGDCWGEDNLWEHGFCHTKVLEVPLIIKLGAAVQRGRRLRASARHSLHALRLVKRLLRPSHKSSVNHVP